MEADGDVAGFHITVADDEHGVDLRLFGIGDLGLDGVGAEIGLSADLLGAQFVEDRLRVIGQRLLVADGQQAHLIRREPEREVARVMFDEEAGFCERSSRINI